MKSEYSVIPEIFYRESNDSRYFHGKDECRDMFYHKGWVFCSPHGVHFLRAQKTNQKRAPDIALFPKPKLICGAVENSLRSDTRPLLPQIKLNFGGDMMGVGGYYQKCIKEDK